MVWLRARYLPFPEATHDNEYFTSVQEKTFCLSGRQAGRHATYRSQRLPTIMIVYMVYKKETFGLSCLIECWAPTGGGGGLKHPRPLVWQAGVYNHHNQVPDQ